MPPAKPNPPTMDHCDRKEDRTGNQETPKPFIKTGVQMLTPPSERRESD
jgi:hypothetical protein